MTNEEAIKILDRQITATLKQRMEAIDLAIQALKERDDLLERAYGHVVGQGANGVIREKR